MFRKIFVTILMACILATSTLIIAFADVSANGATLQTTLQTNGSVSITIEASSKAYDGTPCVATITNIDVWTAEGLTIPTIKYYKSGEKTELSSAPRAAGMYTAKMTAEGATASCEFIITPKQLTATGTIVECEKLYDGTDVATVSTKGTLQGVVGNDDVSIGTATATFDNKNIGESKTVTVQYTITGADAGNYATPKSYDISSGKISPKTITVTADNKTMNLGNQVPEFTATVEGLIKGDTITYDFNVIQPNAQGIYSIVPSGNKNQENYIVTYKQGTLTVSEENSNVKVDSAALTEILEKYRVDANYSGKKLDVELRTNGTVSQADKDKIVQKAGNDKKLDFFDANLILTVNDGGTATATDIGDENSTLIGITYQFNFRNKENVQVFRVHNDVCEELTETANANGEHVSFDKNAGTITVYAKKYSAYAISYKTVSYAGTFSEISSPKTGDSSNLWFCGVLNLLAVCTFMGTIVKKRGR